MDRYDKIINLVKETSIAYEQNKKLKDLKKLKELERGIYNHSKLDRTSDIRTLSWDPIVKKSSENSDIQSVEPQKYNRDIRMNNSQRRHFNYPTPIIFEPKSSNTDQFVSTFENFADWNDISTEERAQLFQLYLSPKTFEWLNSLPKEIKQNYKSLIDSFLTKYKLDGEEILSNFSQEPDLEVFIAKFEKMAQLDMPPNVLKRFL